MLSLDTFGFSTFPGLQEKHILSVRVVPVVPSSVLLSVLDAQEKLPENLRECRRCNIEDLRGWDLNLIHLGWGTEIKSFLLLFLSSQESLGFSWMGGPFRCSGSTCILGLLPAAVSLPEMVLRWTLLGSFLGDFCPLPYIWLHISLHPLEPLSKKP